MNQKKTIKQTIFFAEDLRWLEGWEVRKINTSERRPGIILQNPDTGEKRKLQFRSSVFDGESMTVIKGKRQL